MMNGTSHVFRVTVTRWVLPEVEGTFALVGGYAVAFTPSDINTLVVAIAALITAVGTVVVNLMTTARMGRQMSGVQSDTKEIKHSVNSAAAAQVARIEGLERELRLMREFIADKKETAALLAQAAVAVPTLEKVQEVAHVLSGHDEWERGDREKLAAEVKENTRLTQEIRDAMLKEKP